jgi:succinate dehydrogenase / fumarate reductase cytochrome b subunit
LIPQSTIGKKIVVAVTGLVLFGFVAGHLAGNLQIFLGPDAINHYSAFLHSMPKALWTARIVLLLSVFLHVVLTIQLTRLNRAARPVAYESFDPQRSSVASRTMIWGGVMVFFYIIYHLLHLTTGTVHPNFNPHDVYANLITGLSVWYVAAFYIAANIALGFHLYHGVWSVFQTLGLNHPKYNPWRRVVASLAGVGIAAGYVSIPAAVLLGVVR